MRHLIDPQRSQSTSSMKRINNECTQLITELPICKKRITKFIRCHSAYYVVVIRSCAQLLELQIHFTFNTSRALSISLSFFFSILITIIMNMLNIHIYDVQSLLGGYLLLLLLIIWWIHSSADTHSPLTLAHHWLRRQCEHAIYFMTFNHTFRYQWLIEDDNRASGHWLPHLQPSRWSIEEWRELFSRSINWSSDTVCGMRYAVCP